MPAITLRPVVPSTTHLQSSSLELALCVSSRGYPLVAGINDELLATDRDDYAAACLENITVQSLGLRLPAAPSDNW